LISDNPFYVVVKHGGAGRNYGACSRDCRHNGMPYFVYRERPYKKPGININADFYKDRRMKKGRLLEKVQRRHRAAMYGAAVLRFRKYAEEYKRYGRICDYV